MAQDTPADLRTLVMYSVFVRQHSPEGTFAAVEADLPRIRALGVDLVCGEHAPAPIDFELLA
jgi:hypothetical protein